MIKRLYLLLTTVPLLICPYTYADNTPTTPTVIVITNEDIAPLQEQTARTKLARINRAIEHLWQLYQKHPDDASYAEAAEKLSALLQAGRSNKQLWENIIYPNLNKPLPPYPSDKAIADLNQIRKQNKLAEKNIQQQQLTLQNNQNYQKLDLQNKEKQLSQQQQLIQNQQKLIQQNEEILYQLRTQTNFLYSLP